MTATSPGEAPTFPLRIDAGTALPLRLTGVVIDRAHDHFRLAELPMLPALPIVPGARTTGAGGIAAAGGRVFWIDASTGMVMQRLCDDTSTAVTCFDETAWDRPAGIAASADLLFVSDPAFGRIVSLASDSGQLIDLWSGLDEPGDLTIDDDGVVYAATRSGVVRLRSGGRWERIALLDHAHSLVAVDGRLLVAVSGDDPGIFTVDLATAAVEPAAIHPTSIGPWMLRATSALLLVIDLLAGTAEAFDRETASPLGLLPSDAAGPVGLAVDECDRVWVSNGSAVSMAGPSSVVSSGQIEVGPFPVPILLDGEPPPRFRVKAHGAPGDGSVHLDVHFSPPGPTPEDSAPDDGEPGDEPPPRLDDRIVQAGVDSRSATLVVTLFAPEVADFTAITPILDAVEVRTGDTGLIDFLPHIYRSQGDPDEFLDPFLRLLASGNDDVVDGLEDLVRQFDPSTATDQIESARWLDWLASWTDAQIDESWPPERRRQVVEDAFESHGRRGTAAAIQQRIELELELSTTIVEPGDLTSLWVLGDEGAELGMTSMTSAAPADGSIVGTTAQVDRSHLIGPGDRGAPLFGDLAHRFHVMVPRLGLDEDQTARLWRIIDREKPAHTDAHVCCPDGGFHLGLGGRIGIDLVIAGPTYPNAVEGLDGFDENATTTDSFRLDAGAGLILS